MVKKTSRVKIFERVKSKVDASEIKAQFKADKIPPDKLLHIQNWLKEIIVLIRHYEEDIGVDESGKLLIKNAQTPISDFSEASNSLRGVIKIFNRLDKPRQRYIKDPTRDFYYPETGADQLRNALAYELSKIFSPDRFNNLNIDLSQFISIQPATNRDMPIRGLPRTEPPRIDFNRAGFQSAVASESNYIAAMIIQQISDACLQAAKDLEPYRKNGGEKANPIKELIFTNLPQLFHDVFPEKRIYVDEAYRDFFDFAKNICGLMGVRSYCTTYQLRAGIARWNIRSGQKGSQKPEQNPGRKPGRKKKELSTGKKRT